MTTQAAFAGARAMRDARAALVAPPAVVRPWRPGDEALVAATEPHVSAVSFYRRFFVGGDRFPPRYLERLAANVTVLATAGATAVGWAEIGRYADPPWAGELGVLVVDRWQHRGLGPRLARAALAEARRRGICVVYADVLETNHAARRALTRTFGDRLQVGYDGDVLHYVLPLVPAAPAAAQPGGANPAVAFTQRRPS